MTRMPVEQRRHELIEAASRIVAAKGLSHATTRAIVAEAKMSLASFHYVFESRDELIEKLITVVLTSEEKAVMPSEVEGKSLTDLLTEGLLGYLNLLRADPTHEQAMLELTQHALRNNPSVARQQYEQYTQFAHSILRIAAEQTGSRWTVPLPAVATLLIALTDGLTLSWLVDRDDARAENAVIAAGQALASLAELAEPMVFDSLSKGATMKVRTDGALLRDEDGRHRVFHGINLVAKGTSRAEGTFVDRGFKGSWTPGDIADLAGRGFTLVRLGIIWAAIEPEPGQYDESYLDWVSEQLDLIGEAGMCAVLDAHQDLYSQSYSDGAPAWATLTTAEYEPAELWSDAYLASPAVHEALDNFWGNAPGPDGVGLQDRFAAMWSHVAKRFRTHPAVIGYDLLNEPTPGSAAPEIFANLIGAFAQVTGQDPERLFADFSTPEAKFAQLARLDDEAVHRQIGDAIHPLVAEFESKFVAPFMARVREAVRMQDTHSLILREHDYFANLGIPSGQPPLADGNWVYSPHGYDLTVDTPAIAMSSNTRAGTIFARAGETAERLAVPVIVGEWGALNLGAGIADHGRFLQDLFDSFRWSWTYWVWEEGFAESEAAATLTRARPIAFAGEGVAWGVDGATFRARWRGAPTTAPSVFYAPTGDVTLLRNGEQAPALRDGAWITVPPGEGDYELTVG